MQRQHRTACIVQLASDRGYIAQRHIRINVIKAELRICFTDFKLFVVFIECESRRYGRAWNAVGHYYRGVVQVIPCPILRSHIMVIGIRCKRTEIAQFFGCAIIDQDPMCIIFTASPLFFYDTVLVCIDICPDLVANSAVCRSFENQLLSQLLRIYHGCIEILQDHFIEVTVIQQPLIIDIRVEYRCIAACGSGHDKHLCLSNNQTSPLSHVVINALPLRPPTTSVRPVACSDADRFDRLFRLIGHSINRLFGSILGRRFFRFDRFFRKGCGQNAQNHQQTEQQAQQFSHSYSPPPGGSG